MKSLRDKISAAAQELYLRDGIEGVSMRRVADPVGVTAPAIYRHFKNKDELLSEIVTEGLKILVGYLRPALESGEPYDRLVGMTDAYLDFAILAPSPDASPVVDEIARPDWDTFRLAVEQVASCIEAGLFPEDDPLELAITIWAEEHGLVTLFRTGRFGQDPELFRGVYKGAVDRMFRSLKALTETAD